LAIYRDKKRGTYFFSVYVKSCDGENKRYVRRGFKTRSEARKAEAEFLLNFDKEDEENVTFEFIAERYLRWYKRRRKASSYNKLESLLRVQLIPRFGDMKVKDIRKRHVTNMQDDLLDEYSVSHAKKIHTTLSATLNFGITQEYLEENVAREVGNIDLKPKKHMNFWVLDEFKQFLSVVGDLTYRSFFMTLYYGGLRKGEALALTWADIDFKNSTINIDKTVYQRVVTSPKNESSVRKIKMPQHTMRLLKKLKLQNKNKPNYVVFGEYKDHISETTIDRHYDQFIKKSGVKRIRLHDFRHSHVSYLINKGVDITLISKRVGHADPSTTLDIYGHLYPTAEQEVIDLMEDDFKPAEVIGISDKIK